MGKWMSDMLARRPWWMNLLMVFCAFVAAIYMPLQIFHRPLDQMQQVWFGYMFTGWAAKLVALPHWFLYAAACYGFWRMRPLMWPWAALYAAQVALASVVWGLAYVGGGKGLMMGVLPAIISALAAWALWNARERFRRERLALKERYGDWALITGASAGIGADFARALAHEGVSCALVARREDRLRELASELERNHKVETRVIAADLASPDGSDRVAQAVKDLPISILINNAGFGYAGRFDKQDARRLREMVELNCVTPVVLTSRLIGPMMHRGRGAIVVVGSVAGCQPLPLHNVYAATKAFDERFGEALWAELREQGIDVVVLEPGPVATEFQQVAGELSHSGVPSMKVVRDALEALGGPPTVISGWFNWIRAQAAMRLMPHSITALIARGVTGQWTPGELR